MYISNDRNRAAWTNGAGSQAYVTTPGRTHSNANSTVDYIVRFITFFLCRCIANSNVIPFCVAPEKYWIIIIIDQRPKNSIIWASVITMLCEVQRGKNYKIIRCRSTFGRKHDTSYLFEAFRLKLRTIVSLKHYSTGHVKRVESQAYLPHLRPFVN